MDRSDDLSKKILDTALQLAEDHSWEALRLHDIAKTLDVSLTDIQQHFQQKDDLVEAWYDRADCNMLHLAQSDEFTAQNKTKRLHMLIMAWLDKLAEHKTVSRDMLLYKLEPAHIHLQVLGVLRISRTVQWFLEASQSKTTHLCRIAEEVKLTTIYLTTFSYWMFDQSEHQHASRDFLWASLKRL